jgi:serine/threonine protein kinase
MCPECADGEFYDAYEADVWAFGVTMYVVLFGRVPWFDETGTLHRVCACVCVCTNVYDLCHYHSHTFMYFGNTTHTHTHTHTEWRLSEMINNDPLVIPAPAAFAGVGSEARDLLSRLLHKDLAHRIRSITEVSEHPFFSSVAHNSRSWSSSSNSKILARQNSKNFNNAKSFTELKMSRMSIAEEPDTDIPTVPVLLGAKGNTQLSETPGGVSLDRGPHHKPTHARLQGSPESDVLLKDALKEVA